MQKESSFIDLIEAQPNVVLALEPATTEHLHLQSCSSVSSSPNSSITTSTSSVPERRRWSCHKDILKSSSNYFASIFNNQFQETEASIVFLPRGIFSSSVLDDVLCYMYTKSIRQPVDDCTLETLEQLQSVYMAADYLGMDNLCVCIHQHIVQLTHGLTCYCHSCTLLIPELLLFTGPNQEDDPRLSAITHSIIKLLITDPEKTLPTFWSSPTLAYLLSQSAEMESLHNYLQERLLEHVNKNNAIETLYGCFLAKEGNNTSVLASTQKKLQQTGSKLLADHFDFYCTKYPKLLSCVDGITYSFDFLEYLLTRILSDHMNEMNACSLYKGIVRSLMCRSFVQPPVKAILQTAKNKTVRYIGGHLRIIKELNVIDKSIVEQLAYDLVLPPATLLNDDDSTKRNKHGNNGVVKHRRTPSNLSHNSSSTSYFGDKKKLTYNTPWDIKMRSHLCSLMFGQAALHFKVGQRVRLLNRPVLTIGTILFVGKLEVAAMTNSNKSGSKISFHIHQVGICLGVELDRSVGSNDGSIEGKRYFTTLPNRGIFVKPSEVALA